MTILQYKKKLKNLYPTVEVLFGEPDGRGVKWQCSLVANYQAKTRTVRATFLRGRWRINEEEPTPEKLFN